MAEEKKQKTEEKKEKKTAEASEEKKKEEKAEDKQEKKEEGKKPAEAPKKTEAVTYGRNLPISTKHCVAICKFIRGRKIEEANSRLQEVIRMKKAVPMRGEIPHRKGKIMSGRYPIKAAQHFSKLLKQLAANATINEIDLEKARIECKADKASRPYRRFGQTKFKRSHVMLRLKEPSLKKKPREEKKKQRKI